MTSLSETAAELIRTNPALANEVARQLAPAVGGLTERQHDLLAFITRHVEQHGFPPSYDQMREELHLASKSGIARMIKGLEKRGFITRLPNCPRAISVVRGAA